MTHSTITIVEDEQPIRQRLITHINALADFRVIGEAGSLATASEVLAQTSPDILLVDLGLPDGSGLDIITQQADEHPDMAISVISVFGDEEHVIKAIEAGARGYVLKSDSSLALEGVLTQLRDGGAPISPPIARHLIRRFQPHPEDTQIPSVLSKRELEVLTLAAKGYSFVDIAEMFSVASSTISSYAKRIYLKLEVHSKSEAVFEAQRLGLLGRPERDA